MKGCCDILKECLFINWKSLMDFEIRNWGMLLMLLGFTYGCDKRLIVLHVSEIKCYNVECVCLSLRYLLLGIINLSLWMP